MADPATTDDAAALARLLSLQDPGESDAAFARRLGLAPQVLSNYKNRHHGLSLKSALRVHRAAGISLDWLLAGEGSPRSERNPEEPFQTGVAFVLDRLLRSVAELTVSVERAGAMPGDRARPIRQAIEDYLDGRPGG